MHIIAILGQCKSSWSIPMDVVKLLASLLTSVVACANFLADENGDIRFCILYFGSLYILKKKKDFENERRKDREFRKDVTVKTHSGRLPRSCTSSRCNKKVACIIQT